MYIYIYIYIYIYVLYKHKHSANRFDAKNTSLAAVKVTEENCIKTERSIHACIHTYIHTYMHIYIHIYIYIYIWFDAKNTSFAAVQVTEENCIKTERYIHAHIHTHTHRFDAKNTSFAAVKVAEENYINTPSFGPDPKDSPSIEALKVLREYVYTYICAYRHVNICIPTYVHTDRRVHTHEYNTYMHGIEPNSILYVNNASTLYTCTPSILYVYAQAFT